MLPVLFYVVYLSGISIINCPRLQLSNWQHNSHCSYARKSIHSKEEIPQIRKIEFATSAGVMRPCAFHFYSIPREICKRKYDFLVLTQENSDTALRLDGLDQLYALCDIFDYDCDIRDVLLNLYCHAVLPFPISYAFRLVQRVYNIVKITGFVWILEVW